MARKQRQSSKSKPKIAAGHRQSQGTASSNQNTRRPFWQWLLLITVIGAIFRLWIGFELAGAYSPVSMPTPGTDMATYREKASEFLNGQYDFAEGFYYQPFYYTVFLPLIFLIFGEGAGGTVFVQALLSTGTIWLVGLTFARLYGRKAGLIGAALFALCRISLFYVPISLIATLQSFWMILIVYLLVLVVQRRKHAHFWLLLGLVAGCANLTRGNIILLLPCMILPLLVQAWKSRKWLQQAICLLALLIGFYLPQLPYAWKNYQIMDTWTGPSTAAGEVLAIGNTPEAPPGGREPFTGPGPMAYPPSYSWWCEQEDPDKTPVADIVPVSENMKDWMSREPLAWLELKWRMFLLFWNRDEIPNNVAMHNSEGRRITNVTGLYLPVFLDFNLLGSLGLAGMALALWRRSSWLSRATIGMVMLYAGSIVLFYILSRFRVPVMPLVCGFVGYACIRIGRDYQLYKKKKQSKPLLIGLVIFLFTFIFVNMGFQLYQLKLEPALTRMARPHGVISPLKEGWLVADHGPTEFGGWREYPLSPTGKVQKVFSFPEFLSTGTEPLEAILSFDLINGYQK